tara:strand:+ start:2972 stop:3187 length:216 start_codon:yes stop_codon:yes gene_type:complete
MTHQEIKEIACNNGDLTIEQLVKISNLPAAEVLRAVAGSPWGQWLINNYVCYESAHIGFDAEDFDNPFFRR